MTKQQLWEAYCEQNPAFKESASITITANGLYKMFDKTWQWGYSEGYDAGLSDDNNRNADNHSVHDFLTKLMGKGKKRNDF